MKKIIAILIFGFSLSLVQAQEDELTKVPLDMVVFDLDGNEKSLGDIIKHEGLTLVDFWATWCKPCLFELSTLKDEYPTWRDEYNAKVVLISIDEMSKLPKILQMTENKKWEFEQYIDQSGVSRKEMGVTQIPNLFLVDKEGNVLLHELGYSKHGVNKIDKIIKKNQN